ncbi:MAG: 5-formyltetrahydrofolate cyclo-ligase [Oscillospiraceae bacterium]|nr:5-formyltetrahydrofolate cyclo-ligase [Oscillospiraceae bacterium]
MTSDIRNDKNAIRAQCKRWRKKLAPEEKEALDERIFKRVTSLWSYRETDTLFAYASGPLEVDTFAIIRHALETGKKVALPRCIDDTRDMIFGLIDSVDDLEDGAYGVLAPKEYCEKAEPQHQSLCLVPGLTFDMNGARLGFGKGYYDRFLTDFPGNMAGLCYEGCLRPRVPCGRYDQKIPVVVTEKRVIRTNYK